MAMKRYLRRLVASRRNEGVVGLWSGSMIGT